MNKNYNLKMVISGLALSLPMTTQAVVLDYEAVPKGYVYGEVIEQGFSTSTRRCSSYPSIEACVQNATYLQQFNAGLGNDDSRWINYQQNYLSLNSGASLLHTVIIKPTDTAATFTLSGLSLSKAYRYDAAQSITIAGYDENLLKTVEVTVDVSGGLESFILSGFENLKAISLIGATGLSRFSFDKIDVTAATADSYTCTGFSAPMDKNVSVKKNRALPYKAILTDGNGAEITNTDITSAPVISVMYSSSATPEGAVEVDSLSPGQSFEGNQFEYIDGQWQFNLSTKNYTASGNYFVEMRSGDSTEYNIDPSCIGTFTVK
ncbi:hypothetical protein [Neptuniibacter caesariensis]|uniref:Uncharacterized protein n=1 Tax=Neptuniibacter caesariensis TaxID=207954 RepID=A0A7U8C5H0_NEPCE|nr:hypothetical protein [Neptuniibacter caesariensis]EAR60455.1 hypothetical protein MED92_09001 [Oceanospirillum sp. MED92] [Neptuniibacter caesariensis]